MYRQGDLLIVPATVAQMAEAAKNGERASRHNGALVLAYGESSGHMHAIPDEQVEVIATSTDQFIQARAPFSVVHDEHDPIQIPAGAFRVIRQREYVPSRMSLVIAD